MCKYVCKKCNKLIKSTAVVVKGTEPNQLLAITIDEKKPENLSGYCLVICQAIRSDLTIPVVIMNGKTSIPMICKKGNILRADQINSRVKYSLTYGNDPIHFIVNSCVDKTKYLV